MTSLRLISAILAVVCVFVVERWTEDSARCQTMTFPMVAGKGCWWMERSKIAVMVEERCEVDVESGNELEKPLLRQGQALTGTKRHSLTSLA